MIEWLSTLPHCSFFDRPWLAGTHLLSDVCTGLAYFLISGTIEYIRRKRNMPFNGLAIMFVSFILLCGIGHFLQATATVWAGPWYWIEAVNKTATGIVSLFTAFYMIKNVQKLIGLPVPETYEQLLETVRWHRQNDTWRRFGKVKHD